MWNDDQFGGGSFGTPAAGDFVDSNSNTVELNTTVTAVTFSTAMSWNVVSGDTFTSRGCTFQYPLSIASGASVIIDKTAPVTNNQTTFDASNSGNFALASGGSFVVNSGCVCLAQGSMAFTANDDIEVNGQFAIDCALGQTCVQFASGKQFVGIGVIAFSNIASTYSTAPFIISGATFNLTLLAGGGGGGSDASPVGRSSGV